MNIKYILLLSLIVLFGCKEDNIIDIKDTGTLPKLEISIDDYYLWSPDSGLYVIGNNNSSPNWIHNWEHPASIRYSENNNVLFESTLIDY